MKRSCHLYEMSESKETVKEEENKEKKTKFGVNIIKLK